MRSSPRSPALPLLTLLALGAAPLAAQEAEPARPSAEVTSLVEGNTRFALDLFARLRVREGNLAFSPHSLSTALAMTQAAARGRTAEEIEQALRFPLRGDALHAAFAELAGQLEIERAADGPALELSVANALWSDVRETIRPEYLELLRSRYRGGVEPLDFRDPAAAAERINTWTSERTLERIPELVQPDDVDGVAFVLTNAIAFRGDWHLPFDPEQTTQEGFHVSAERVVQVPTMHRRGPAHYARTERFEMLELAFDGERHAMAFLLPREPDGLAELERTLTPEELTACLAGLQPTTVRIALPRFELRARFELADVLSALGMPTAFGGEADFTGMIETPGVFLTRVIHEAFVAVDERGAEAAAATAVIGKRSAPPIAFQADHPFLFLIRERTSGALLFLGRCVEP